MLLGRCEGSEMGLKQEISSLPLEEIAGCVGDVTDGKISRFVSLANERNKNLRKCVCFGENNRYPVGLTAPIWVTLDPIG